MTTDALVVDAFLDALKGAIDYAQDHGDHTQINFRCPTASAQTFLAHYAPAQSLAALLTDVRAQRSSAWAKVHELEEHIAKLERGEEEDEKVLKLEARLADEEAERKRLEDLLDDASNERAKAAAILREGKIQQAKWFARLAEWISTDDDPGLF